MIRSLTLRDFKSFGEVEVPLGTFSLIVGTNASGKSNLRDALRFLHGVGLGFTIAEIFGEKYGPGGILQWRGIRGGLPEAIRQGERSFEIGFESDSCERGTILYEPDANAPHSSISDEMKRGLASMRFLDLSPDEMRKPSNSGQIVLGDRGENLSSVLQAICRDPSREATLLEWVRALTPLDASDLTFETDFSGRILVHLVEASGAKISAASASDGTLRFLATVAALLSEDTGRIYVFEELDNGIHPTRLHLLLDLIERACDEQAIQVIATTHNPTMLGFLSERARDDALLIYRGNDHRSHVRRIMDLPDIKKILEKQDLGQLLTSGWLEDAAAFGEPDHMGIEKSA